MEWHKINFYEVLEKYLKPTDIVCLRVLDLAYLAGNLRDHRIKLSESMLALFKTLNAILLQKMKGKLKIQWLSLIKNIIHLNNLVMREYSRVSYSDKFLAIQVKRELDIAQGFSNFLLDGTPPLVTRFNFHSPLNKLNIKLQNMNNLTVFNTFYMRKESVNYKGKYILN